MGRHLSWRALLVLGVGLYTLSGCISLLLTDIDVPPPTWVIVIALSGGLLLLAWNGRIVWVWVLLVLALVGVVSQLVYPTEPWRRPVGLADLCAAIAFAAVLRMRSKTNTPATS